MRRVLITILKVFGFYLLWALLLAPIVMSAVTLGGQDWFNDIEWRVFVEIGGTLAVLAVTVFMALALDKRGLGTLGFGAAQLPDLLVGAALGALIFAAPLALLLAIGAARIAPDLSGFTANALAVSLLLCFFNVVTQEVLARGYIFQELWRKYGAPLAIGVSSLIFVALHAAPVSQGAPGLIAGLNILIASVMLGLAYVRTNALWLPIGIHLGWNALQGPVLGINVTGNTIAMGYWRVLEFPGEPLLTGGGLGVEGGLAGLIGPLLGLAVILLLYRRKPSG